MGWTFVSETHEPMQKLLLPYRGKEITNREWDKLVKEELVKEFGSRAQYVHASDHCSNMKNVGACDCAKTGRALVTRVRRGRPSYYLVL